MRPTREWSLSTLQCYLLECGYDYDVEDTYEELLELAQDLYDGSK